MATKTVSGPLGAEFGRDPTVFFLNVIKREKKLWQRLTVRLAARAGIANWSVKSGGKTYKSRMIARTDDDVGKLATIVALWCIYKPSLVVDEAGRMAYNQGPGPKVKSLDAYNPDTDGDADIAIIGTTDWPIPWGRSGEKGEPISAAILLTAGVGIFVALAPFVLPPLMSFVQDGVKKITDGAVNLGGKESAPPPPKKESKIFGVPATYVAIGGAGLLAYAALRK